MKYIKERKEITNKENKFKLFIDLDGVLCDFQKQFLNIEENEDNLEFEEYREKYGVKKAWELVDKYGVKWWSEMDWHKGGKELWEYVLQYDPIILSSPSRSRDCIAGKAIWCRRELNIKQKEPTVSPKNHRWDEDSKMIFNTQKELFAKRYENSILIDDTKDKIKKWEKEGGIGILHKNVDQTLRELKKIIDKIQKENEEEND